MIKLTVIRLVLIAIVAIVTGIQLGAVVVVLLGR